MDAGHQDAFSSALLESISDAILVTDPEGRIVYANAVCETMFGYSRGELLSRSLEVLVPEHRRAAHVSAREAFARAPVSRAMGAGRLLEGWKKDGSAFPVEVSLGTMHTPPRALFMAIVRDDTERSHAERRYSELVEHAPDAVFIADLDGCYVDVNTAACRLLGCERDELVGKTIADLIPPEDLPRLAETKQYLLTPGATEVSEWTLRRKDGGVVPVEVSATILADGRWQAFVRDISERKRSEEKVRRSEESLARAQRVAHVGSFEWDVQANTVTRSTELCALFGLGPQAETVPPWSLSSMYHPDDRERVLSAVREAGREGHSYRLEHRLVRADGIERVVLHQGEAVTEGERVVRVVGTMLDITERKRLEQELDRLRAEWASIVAHDLRQPLNSMAIQAQLIKRSLAHAATPDDASARAVQSAQEIVRTVGRMSRMVGDLLDLSRLEARRLELAPCPSDVVAIARKVIDPFGFDHAGPAMVLRVEGSIPLVNVDPDRVAQVFENLLSNAVKYGTRLEPIVVEIRATTDAVHVSVSNTGAGISPEDLPRMFGRFLRAEDVKRSAVKGIGLGLYITRELVLAHGGEISVESVPGGRTTFRFTIPARARVPTPVLSELRP